MFVIRFSYKWAPKYTEWIKDGLTRTTLPEDAMTFDTYEQAKKMHDLVKIHRPHFRIAYRYSKDETLNCWI